MADECDGGKWEESRERVPRLEKKEMEYETENQKLRKRMNRVTQLLAENGGVFCKMIWSGWSDWSGSSRARFIHDTKSYKRFDAWGMIRNPY